MANITGNSTAEIDAPLETVWALVEDVERAPDWQGGLKDMFALERDGDGHPTLCEAETDAKVRTIKSTVRFTYDGPTTLRWTQEKGELKSVDGSWELEDLGGELVEHLAIDPRQDLRRERPLEEAADPAGTVPRCLDGHLRA